MAEKEFQLSPEDFVFDDEGHVRIKSKQLADSLREELKGAGGAAAAAPSSQQPIVKVMM
ncbi:MAG: hypothetical protein QNJ94_03105 [Alphaproteobacteria bacterium]|nr:hypothetical protein [Alphaproteobacteria bacterium]